MIKDYFGKDCENLKNKKLFLFDMDGTIYIDNKLIDGTLQLLEKIKQSGSKYVFITNNSSKSVNDYVKKLASIGIKSNSEEFFTSSQATAIYIKKHFPGKLVYCMGTKSLINELKSSGINVTEEIDDNIGVVLIGFDTELTAKKLKDVCYLLTKDLPYIATNCDYVCPVSFGYIPDCGSYAQIICNATKKMPKFIGKPEPDMINIVAAKLNYKLKDIVVIGDRLYTDIKAGANANVDTICVLSGETTLKDLNESKIKPTYTLNSVFDIYNILK